MGQPVVTMGPLATRIGELEAELFTVRQQVAEMEGKLSKNRKRLHPEVVRKIRDMWDSGFSAEYIADQFRINRGTAYRIGTRVYHKGVI